MMPRHAAPAPPDCRATQRVALPTETAVEAVIGNVRGKLIVLERQTCRSSSQVSLGGVRRHVATAAGTPDLQASNA